LDDIERAVTVRISRNASLKPFNTFGVEANAATLVELLDEHSLDEALQACGPTGPELVLGGGSNLLLTRSLSGAVLRIATHGYRVLEHTGDEAIIEASAGASWHDLVLWTLSEGWSGLENLALIPGSVGASPIQNIGAYGVELCEQFAGLSAVNLRTGEQREFSPEQCAFGYRQSIFKNSGYADWLILRVRFRLSRQARLRLGYGELRSELLKSSVTDPDARQLAAAVIRIRTRKLPSPAQLGNAGSFFKNPVVAVDVAARLLAQYPDMPQFPASAVPSPVTTPAPTSAASTPATEVDASTVKLSAAWMIERCGWKGQRRGDAGVFAQHALVLVNYGAATGAELMALANDIQDSVAQGFGVVIEPEPRII
jgi:UDP-N-acetylmuramate dehydrogenase